MMKKKEPETIRCADLPQSAISTIQICEHAVKEITGKDVILVAYEEEN
ncbi:MAG: hypothetical protein RR977_03780 [Oscillospiraceae bacterium]